VIHALALAGPDPRLEALLFAAVLLAASYLGARLLSWVVARVLRRAMRHATPEDEELVTAVRGPLTASLFLIGAMAAATVLPLGERLEIRLLQGLISVWILATTLCLVSVWKLVLAFVGREKTGTPKPWAKDFGPLLHKVGAVVIGLLGLIAVLESFGVDVNSLVVSLGVGSLAVGLAAQDTLANMFAGFTLMLDRPFLIGDRIQLSSGETGDVETIGIRATRVRTPDETMLVVPNSVLTKEKVVNLSRPTRALTTRADVSVPQGSDLEAAKRVLAAAARQSTRVDGAREPVVIVTRLAESVVNLRVAFWVRDYREQALALSEVHEAIYRGLTEAGIEIPYPVQRVILGTPEPRARKTRRPSP
jgi:small-conductance mechanosensitive channel